MSVIKFYQSFEKIELLHEPPKPADKNIPDWYKGQGSALGEFGSTIKRCMPIFDAMTLGYTLTLPCDIYVDATNPEKLEYFAAPNPSLADLEKELFASHLKDQYSNYPIDPEVAHKEIIRIHPLYSVGTDKGYSCLFTSPIHGDLSPLKVFSAVIDTDVYISDGHFSFTVRKGFKGIIKQGTPLVQVIPFKREVFTSEVVPFLDGEQKLINQAIRISSSFVNRYKNKFRIKKEYK